MGNYASCSMISPRMKSGRAARVIFPGGEIRQFRELVKAAEIMLECPAFFVVNSRALNIGRRFTALSADEDLEFGNVYIMFPMRRLNSIVTAPDMAVVLMAANSATKRISGGGNVRVLPELAEAAASSRVLEGPPESESGRRGLNLEEIEGFAVPEFKHRLAVCRSRKPMLDTITEEPVHAR